MLEQTGASGSFTREIAHAVSRHVPDRVVVSSPGEWRILEAMRDWRARFGVPVDILDDNRFVCSTSEFATWAEDRKQLRMEYFYREMRRKAQMYRTWDSLSDERRQRTLASAEAFLTKLDKSSGLRSSARVLP